ncbi:MAG: hypothetical protein IPF98_20015 [Gemmatimonadetes bacterium]|nr:hypothetical protein [Gemmatimonadota bacterium]MCC6770646.1 hypothetical protein [Gemmatimonadaceae bacterium]
MTNFRSADGLDWTVAVESPSHSSAMIVFVHPSATSRLNRYAWLNARGPKVNDPRARLQPESVLAGLTERDLARLFRRSYPIQNNRSAYIAS